MKIKLQGGKGIQAQETTVHEGTRDLKHGSSRTIPTHKIHMLEHRGGRRFDGRGDSSQIMIGLTQTRFLSCRNKNKKNFDRSL